MLRLLVDQLDGKFTGEDIGGIADIFNLAWAAMASPTWRIPSATNKSAAFTFLALPEQLADLFNLWVATAG